MNLISNYKELSSKVPAQGAWANFRQAGFEFVSQHGLPTRKDEAWHYTSVKSITEGQFDFAAPNTVGLTAEQLKQLSSSEFTKIVFINGFWSQDLSDALPENVKFATAQNFSTSFQDSFDALNAAYSQQVWDLQIASSVKIEKPLQLLFWMTGGATELMAHPRVQIQVGSRSNVSVVESYFGAPVNYLVNSFVSIEVGESAKLVYARVQADSVKAKNIGRTQVKLNKFSQLESLAYSSGSLLSRHSLDVLLTGAGADAQVLGVYATTGSQHVDNTTLIDHQVGECNTNQLYKGILDENSRAVFCGKVLIRKDSQRANSAQLNNNLLLDSKAEADSKPCLEIYADDVKAAHGSTVGQLDADELFYLQSRAIDKEQAIGMLSLGFLSEVIYRISDEHIQNWILKHLESALQGLKIKGS